MNMTGRRRHRLVKRCFSKPLLVLQFEWTYLHTEFIGGYIDTETRTMWRDARVEDMENAQ